MLWHAFLLEEKRGHLFHENVMVSQLFRARLCYTTTTQGYHMNCQNSVQEIKNNIFNLAFKSYLSCSSGILISHQLYSKIVYTYSSSGDYFLWGVFVNLYIYGICSKLLCLHKFSCTFLGARPLNVCQKWNPLKNSNQSGTLIWQWRLDDVPVISRMSQLCEYWSWRINS